MPLKLKIAALCSQLPELIGAGDGTEGSSTSGQVLGALDQPSIPVFDCGQAVSLAQMTEVPNRWSRVKSLSEATFWEIVCFKEGTPAACRMSLLLLQNIFSLRGKRASLKKSWKL